MSNYQRVILTGTLTTQTNFHIGTGEEAIHIDDKKNNITFNTLCLDVNKAPYIPASSLRGYLRKIVAQYEGEDSEALKTLFGLARQKKGSVETGNMGQIRVYDARWRESPTTFEPRIISQTSIDPISNTAKEHQLFSHAVVPPNNLFNVTIEIDEVAEEHIAIILAALDTLNSRYGGKLGKAKNSGQGELEWEKTELKILTHENFVQWLTQTKQKTLDTFYQSDIEVNNIPQYKNTSYKKTELLLRAKSPLLIVDKPFSIKETERRESINKENKNTQNYTPLFEADLYFTKQDGYAVIPGATLKGWARARCRKVLSTLLHKKAKTGGGVFKMTPDKEINQRIDQKIDLLFGSTQAQSILEFSDAKVPLPDCNIHQQNFNAIDRFTGGVLETALYQVEAICPKEALSLSIKWKNEHMTGWMKLLLLFTLRDAMQGDLVLGWGKSKGYGQLSATTDKHTDWVSYYRSLKIDDSEQANMQADLNSVVDLLAEALIEKPEEEIA